MDVALNNGTFDLLQTAVDQMILVQDYDENLEQEEI